MTSPLQFVEEAPHCVFPVKNEITGNIIYIEIRPSHYGPGIIVHKSKPQIVEQEVVSPETAMAVVYLDYYVAQAQTNTKIIGYSAALV